MLNIHGRDAISKALTPLGNRLARAGVSPDLITVIDSNTGQAITTEHLHYGYRVIVLGIPCDEQWRTPAGVALGGPRHFGYDIDYKPIEELNRARGEA